MRSVLSLPKPTPDKIFSVILQSHILSCKSVPFVTRVREALERLAEGEFGLCIRCGCELSTDVLMKDPTESMCPICQTKANA